MKTVKENVQLNVMEELLNSKEMPKTSNDFKMNCDIFNQSPSKMWLYLKNSITPDGFGKLYKRNEMEPELLMTLISGLLEGQETQFDLCTEYLEKFVKVRKFSILRSFLTKAEKHMIAELVLNLECRTSAKAGYEERIQLIKKKFKIK